jgi:hypothetical protein
VPSPCASGCEARYASVASMPSCQGAYLSMLQCGTTQSAASWQCAGSIPMPMAGCTTELSALATQDLTCLTTLAQ